FLDPALGDLSAVDCVFLCDVPVPTPTMVAKLEAHLKRGGGLVIGLGPNAAAGRDVYNRVLFNDGNGILPGSLGDTVTTGSDEPGYRLAADEEVFRRPPLVAFRGDNERAGLLFSAPFKAYVKLDAPPDGRARRILSFIPTGGVAPAGQKPDAAVVEWVRHRGRVVVYTSTFNQDWTDWPVAPSYLPFMHEVLRFAAANPDRHTLRVGDAIEEFFPLPSVGLPATVTTAEGVSLTTQVAALEEVGVVRFADTHLSGLYRMGVGAARDRVFAVNVPETLPSGGSESDLRRIDQAELKTVGSVQIVSDTTDIKPTGESSGTILSMPKPHGPAIARVLMVIALIVLAVELVLAWRFGPARNAAGGPPRVVERRWYWRLLSTTLALLPLAVAAFILFALIHAERTGNLLGFLPHEMRSKIEAAAGVPVAAPGEGTKWRLEGFTAFVRNSVTDRRIVLTFTATALLLTLCIYRLERRAGSGLKRLILPGALRTLTFLIALFFLLPQLRIAFDREGWPEVVILLDTSASMATTDDLKDPAVREKAEELRRAAGLSEAHRLKLAQLLLTKKDADWLDILLREKQVKVYIFAVDSQSRQLADLDDPRDLDKAREVISNLRPDGASSKLGDGVQAVLKSFRGSSLAALIMFTDGVTTSGDDLPKAAREASRAGVPLFLVGVGDTREVPDLGLTAIQVEDVVTRGDRLMFAGRLTARGQLPNAPVPVVLYERQGEKLVERGRTSVTPNPSAGFTEFKITHTPMEAGEKQFVIEVAAAPGEVETGNNKVERTVVVTETKRIRVLYVEGETRYDFRYVKVLLERESDRVAGNKSIELKTVLLSAAKGWSEIDRSALADFPTRDQLFEYDVVILGDVDPKSLPRTARTLQDLTDFVKVR
ncbi:MAG TPA: vWA domain-containing protein, partial [Gemmataceae bacterium]|nr:vWA domain-containing protein [Gemmataceae bacterium]